MLVWDRIDILGRIATEVSLNIKKLKWDEYYSLTTGYRTNMLVI